MSVRRGRDLEGSNKNLDVGVGERSGMQVAAPERCGDEKEVLSR